MVENPTRCPHCGTLLNADDTSCPACGASVDQGSLFPSSEEFVDESYQNIDETFSSDEETYSVEDPEPSIDEDDLYNEPLSEQIYSPSTSTMPEPPSSGNRALRACGVSCIVFVLIVLCCAIVFGIVLWFTGDLILEMLNSFGTFY